MTTAPARPLHEIAREISMDWGLKINYAAQPYLNAMAALNEITDMYGYDSAEEIVLRFLGNATSWRGETARRVKAELRAMIK